LSRQGYILRDSLGRQGDILRTDRSCGNGDVLSTGGNCSNRVILRADSSCGDSDILRGNGSRSNSNILCDRLSRRGDILRDGLGGQCNSLGRESDILRANGSCCDGDILSSNGSDLMISLMIDSIVEILTLDVQSRLRRRQWQSGQGL
jgi:hypothetical protein